MSQFQWSLYLNLLMSWMTSGKTWQEAASLAVECLESLAHLNLASPTGALIVTMLQGVIAGKLHQQLVALPNGDVHPAGPVTNAAQAVALALQFANEHEAQVAPAPEVEAPVPPPAPVPAPSTLQRVGAFLSGALQPDPEPKQ